MTQHIHSRETFRIIIRVMRVPIPLLTCLLKFLSFLIDVLYCVCCQERTDWAIVDKAMSGYDIKKKGKSEEKVKDESSTM
ncbi:hypothetical protein [Phaffia rhodozyma]|uniref:Uncharacterized protein n=1 Tax=Phaffia rhodozyma TaxID=264483 RepID=A0A0F7STN4_PHARH|nr:hypothetical protein [Phaffia rhodozyma]